MIFIFAVFVLFGSALHGQPQWAANAERGEKIVRRHEHQGEDRSSNAAGDFPAALSAFVASDDVKKAAEHFSELYSTARTETEGALDAQAAQAEDVFILLLDVYVYKPMLRSRIPALVKMLTKSQAWKSATQVQRVKDKVKEMAAAIDVTADTIHLSKNMKVQRFMDDFGVKLEGAEADIEEPEEVVVEVDEQAPEVQEDNNVMPEAVDPNADPVLPQGPSYVPEAAGPGHVAELPGPVPEVPGPVAEEDEDDAAESLPPGWVPAKSSQGEYRVANEILQLQVRSARIAWMAHDGELDELCKLPYNPPNWETKTDKGKTWLHNQMLGKSVWTKRQAWEYVLPPPGWTMQESKSNPGKFKFTYAEGGLSFYPGPEAWLWQNGKLDKLASRMLPPGWTRVESMSKGHKYWNQQRQQQVYNAKETWQLFTPPPGWRKVQSRSQPEKFCYQNNASKKRVWSTPEAWEIYAAAAGKH